MKTLFHPLVLGLTILVVTAGVLGFRWGAHRASNNALVPAPDTVYVDRPLLKRDTVKVVQPVEVKVFHTVQELRTDTVRVPVNFNPAAVIGANPVTQRRGKLTLTSFDLQQNAFTQRTYSLPARKWGISLHTKATYFKSFAEPSITLYMALSLELGIRYRRITVVPTIGVYEAQEDNMGIFPEYRVFYGASIKYRWF